MVDQVIAHQGTLDKFIGDAVMAIFGAPVPLPDHAERACRAALAMIAELDDLQARWTAEGREPFRIGIGINSGDMVVGNLGSEQLFDYTVVGDGVNLGARLESLNKEYQTKVPIIISESTYEAAKEHLEVRRLGEVIVAAVFAGLLVLAMADGAQAQTAAGGAEIKQMTGRVEVLRKGQNEWAPATTGAKLVDGDQIRAHAGASAELGLPDGSTLFLAENSRLAMTKVEFDEATKSRTGAFHLVVGKVR